MAQKRIYTRPLPLSRWMFPMLLALLLCCCKSGGDEPVPLDIDNFVSKKECGLYGYGGYLIKYSEKGHQLSVNKGRKQVRLQSDDQSAYFNVVFAVKPVNIDEVVSVNFTYKGGGDEISSTMEMLFCKVTDDLMWFWNEDERMGIIVPHF